MDKRFVEKGDLTTLIMPMLLISYKCNLKTSTVFHQNDIAKDTPQSFQPIALDIKSKHYTKLNIQFQVNIK